MKKILIIDDSNFSRKILRKILEKLNYQVTEASDGMTALESFTMQQPDAVLLDLNMTGMKGLDVLSKLIEINPNAKIVIASADIQESTQQMAMDIGASGYIFKPFTEDKISEILTQLLKKENNGH
ncbi:MAG: response regulator [Bacteroidota bacterium]